MTKLYAFTFVLVLFSGIVSAQMDTDNDGMSDEFEVFYFLNSDDPTDAFADTDGDGVLNLQEYILNTYPSDPASPQEYNHNPADPLENIYDRMMNAGNEPAFIRMAEGEYDFSYGFFADGDYTLMIQGGWNADFTDYNPCLYPTVLNQAAGGFSGTISTASINGTAYNIVLDGLELVNASVGLAAVELINDSNASRIHLHNLKLYNNTVAYGALISGRLGCTDISI